MSPAKKTKPRAARSTSAESGLRPSFDLPPLDASAPTTSPKPDPELESRVFALVTAVAREDGRGYPPEWATVVDATKRRGFLTERGFKLYLTDHGRQWLRVRAEPGSGRKFEMTKITLATRLELKELAHSTGVPMQEVIGHVIGAVYEHRDALTRVALAHGAQHPWEAIRLLLARK